MPLTTKVKLALRIWVTFLRVHYHLARHALPEVVRRFSVPGDQPAELSVATLSRAVDRSLRVGRRRPRCLINALVLYRLLRADGHPVELVIGLPPDPADHDAHAWVELHGADVGPPPGQGGHVSLARYS